MHVPILICPIPAHTYAIPQMRIPCITYQLVKRNSSTVFGNYFSSMKISKSLIYYHDFQIYDEIKYYIMTL